MDITGLAKILSNCITDIFALLSKNSKKSSTEHLLCDICGELRTTVDMRQVMGGICVCKRCTSAIVVFYILNSPIKTLCPHCSGQQQSANRCNYCDLPVRIGEGE